MPVLTAPAPLVAGKADSFLSRLAALPQDHQEALVEYVLENWEDLLDLARWESLERATTDEVVAHFQAQVDQAHRDGTVEPSGPDRF